MIKDRPGGFIGYRQRSSEGWGFDEDEHIARAGDGFKSDEEALAFVQRRAAEGSEYHAECLVYATLARIRR